MGYRIGHQVILFKTTAKSLLWKRLSTHLILLRAFFAAFRLHPPDFPRTPSLQTCTLGCLRTAPFTTSSTKKRKLALPESRTSKTETTQHSSETLGSSQARQSSPLNYSTQNGNQNSTPSPPIYLPVHLRGQTYGEGSGRGLSPVPDYTCSAASSPSAAYAGLTLDGERGGDMSSTENNGSAPLNDSGRRSSNSSFLGSNTSLDIMASKDQAHQRSSSPGIKRPASDLEENLGVHNGVDTESLARKELDSQKDPDSPMKDVDDEPLTRSTTRTKLRNQRSSSVDMLSDEPHADTVAGDPSTNFQSSPTPSIDEQVKMVKELADQPLTDGMKGYLLSYKWLGRITARSSEGLKGKSNIKDPGEGGIGPIDNSDLVPEAYSETFQDQAEEPFVPIKAGLQITEDFYVIPEAAWNLVVGWHGIKENSPVIIRYAHNTNEDSMSENIIYELYPPVFTILKLRNDNAGQTAQMLKESSAAPVKILASRHESFNKFLKQAKEKAGIDLQTKVRVWRILNVESYSGVMTPASSRSASPAPGSLGQKILDDKLLVDVNTFMSLQDGSQREMLDAKDQTANSNYNGHSSLVLVGLGRDETLVLEEQSGGNRGGAWVTEVATRNANKHGIPISVTKSGITTTQTKSKHKGTLGIGKPNSGSGTGMMTRGRERRQGATPGKCGLSNLGNTCYMNSALQCIRSVEELTQYFLLDKYKRDLHPSNPLAHNGEVAKAYASLLHSMYSEHNPTSFAPRQFKSTIGRYGPSFSGYGQQDSQEFLGFLLDGLQEDLNRVLKKPYIEKPDSTDEMVNDPAALEELAQKCWDIYKARNDSVIADLFAGSYKSTLVCPVCSKVSITFDPFNNLTLQLPDSPWSKDVTVFPLSGPPVRVSVELDKNASMKALKEFLTRRLNVDPRKLVIAEVYREKFYKMFEDFQTIGEANIGSSDEIAIFEVEDVPTNYPAKQSERRPRRGLTYPFHEAEDEAPDWDSPVAERLLVPVLHRVPREKTIRGQKSFELAAYPQYIVIRREEAYDMDAIFLKVMHQLSNLTTINIFDLEEGLVDQSVSQNGSDTVLTTDEDGEDVSSGSQSKARSVESEDDFVDVSMKDASNGVLSENDSILDQDDSAQRPAVAPHLHHLFRLKYFHDPRDQDHMESNDYPSLESRLRRNHLQEPTSDPPKAGGLENQDTASSSSASEENNIEPPELSNNQEFNLNTGSDSDEELPSPDDLLASHSRNNTNNARHGERIRQPRSSRTITYSKKHKVNPSSRSEPPNDEGPLIRPGEGLILEYDHVIYKRLFGANDVPQDSLGVATFAQPEHLPDPELEKKRELRSTRRRRGVSLSDCLDEFGREEILSESDAWYCPRCKEHRRASKKFELWKSPDILVVHLKRFSASRGLRDKVDCLVDFPVEGLDLSTRVALHEGKTQIYDLFAVDNHYGGLGGGHYTAFAKNFVDGKWYDYNDSHVTEKTNPNGVVTPSAYLLFYRRRSEQPLGGPFFQKIIEEANETEPESETSSRAVSPAGEGQRLDDLSRNGSSSALIGVGAAHQAGTGLAGETPARNDEPPEYAGSRQDGEQTLDGMEMDEDGSTLWGPHTNWTFSGAVTSQTTALPPDSSPEGNLFDADDDTDSASVKVHGSSVFSDNNDRMGDFADDEGLLGPLASTPLRQSPVPESLGDFEGHGLRVDAGMGLEMEMEDEAPVTDVHVEEGEGLSKAE